MNGNNHTDIDSRNLAVMESRLNNMEGVMNRMVSIVESQRNIVQDLAKAISLLQQSDASASEDRAAMRLKVDGLDNNQTMLKGGWVALCIIGAVIVGLAGLVGALASLLSTHK